MADFRASLRSGGFSIAEAKISQSRSLNIIFSTSRGSYFATFSATYSKYSFRLKPFAVAAFARISLCSLLRVICTFVWVSLVEIVLLQKSD